MTQFKQFKQFNTSRLEIFQLHPMDNRGTARGTISADGHAMTVSPWWDNDGTTGELCQCSCGFVSREFSGYGAWQVGHDGPPEEHVFDETHAALREAAAEWERAQPWLDNEDTEYPKAVQAALARLELYEVNDDLIQFDVVHLYPSGLAHPDGYVDCRFFELRMFNSKNMQMRSYGPCDSLDIAGASVETVRIFADGSTLVKFRHTVDLDVAQSVTVYGDAEE